LRYYQRSRFFTKTKNDFSNIINNEKLILKTGAGPYVLSVKHGPVKREAGANPARSRRCERGVLTIRHWETGKAVRTMTLEPEDLPVFEPAVRFAKK
jgi:hypothetical protein